MAFPSVAARVAKSHPDKSSLVEGARPLLERGPRIDSIRCIRWRDHTRIAEPTRSPLHHHRLTPNRKTRGTMATFRLWSIPLVGTPPFGSDCQTAGAAFSVVQWLQAGFIQMEHSLLADMPRDKYVERCKQRAFDYLEQGDLNKAAALFVRDMNARPDCELPDHCVALGTTLLMGNDAIGWRTLIEGLR